MNTDSEQTQLTPSEAKAVSDLQAKAQIEMQAEIAFQGDSIRALNDALALQQQDLLLCKRQIDLLSQQLRALRSDRGEDRSSDAAASLATEPPPHY